MAVALAVRAIVWVGGRAVEGSGNIVAKRACCIASLTSASSVALSVLLLSFRSSLTMSVASFALAELVEAWGLGGRAGFLFVAGFQAQLEGVAY